MKVYDYIFITNLPAFYKINLYNKLSKLAKIKVIFISNSSAIRNADFSSTKIDFEHEFLSTRNYEERNKILITLKILKILFFLKYKKLVFPGWELVELIPLMFIYESRKNCILIESSIIETRSTGFIWFIKKMIIKQMSFAFPSGNLQLEILKHANFTGDYNITHGVGIPNRMPKNNIKKYESSNDYSYLYVGRVAQEKNLSYLVEMFNRNRKKLTIVGDGPLFDKLKSIAKNNISFHGYVNNEDLAHIYVKHDIFILPSISEPWGLVIDEALWYGLPVVVSCNVGCSDDLVIAENTGVTFKLDDDDSFNEALSEIELNYNYYKDNVIHIDFDKRDTKQINSYLAYLNE